MSATEQGRTLQRSQRVRSQADLTTSFTPLSASSRQDRTEAADGPARRPRHHARSASASAASGRLAGLSQNSGQLRREWPFDSEFSARGFELAADPFEPRDRPNSTQTRRAKLDKHAGLLVQESDDWWDRLGVGAARFGGWNEGEGTRWGAQKPVAVQDDEASDGEQERRAAHNQVSGSRKHKLNLDTATRTASKPQPAPLANLAVWHDDIEQGERADLDYDYFRPTGSMPTSPFSSPSLSCSRLSALTVSSPSSPAVNRQIKLAPPPTGRNTGRPNTVASGDDLDTLTHSFLASQDKFGVFGRIESLLEWTLPPAESSKTPHRPSSASTPSALTRSLPSSTNISRVASSHSLAIDNLLPADLEDGAWTERGELSAYHRARSEGNLAAAPYGDIEWADERDVDRQGAKLERVASRDDAATDRGPLREGLAALMDVVGLGSWV